MASEITVTLSGSESEAQFSGANAWLRNDGAATVYAAKAAGVTAGADGTVAVPAGGSAPVYGANGRVFLLGTGSVQLIGSDYSTNPFKTSTATGGSAVDEVARAAVNAHAGNAEVHVTAAEKAAWNGKAEVSDIPTSLPANGGNADTLDGKHASNFATVKKITTQAEVDSILESGIYSVEYLATATTFGSIESSYYMMVVNKHRADVNYNVEIAVPFADGKQQGVYYRNCTNGIWGAWTNVADGGNAASVGAYTEAKLAALEARVAALEAKTQTEGT